jgi:hypothetical protein
MTEFPVPQMRGRQVYLRGLTQEDYPAFHQLDASGEGGVRWRFRGATPGPEQWVQMAWNSVLVQFVVAGTRDNRPIGLVVAYRAEFQHRHAYFAAVGLRRPSPLMIFGCALFFEYAFTCWDFHKLYMELPAYNLPQIASGVGRYFEVEGQLREHSYYGGKMWDEVVLALYRERWQERGRRLLAAASAGKPRLAGVRVPGRGAEWAR